MKMTSTLYIASVFINKSRSGMIKDMFHQKANIRLGLIVNFFKLPTAESKSNVCFMLMGIGYSTKLKILIRNSLADVRLSSLNMSTNYCCSYQNISVLRIMI